jgi:hypothetical protein
LVLGKDTRSATSPILSGTDLLTGVAAL